MNITFFLNKKDEYIWTCSDKDCCKFYGKLIFERILLCSFSFVARFTHSLQRIIHKIVFPLSGSSFVFFLSVSLSVYPFVCLFVCLSLCLSISLSIYLFVCLSLCLSISLSVYLFVCLSHCLSISLSVCHLVCLLSLFFFYLFVCLFQMHYFCSSFSLSFFPYNSSSMV